MSKISICRQYRGTMACTRLPVARGCGHVWAGKPSSDTSVLMAAAPSAVTRHASVPPLSLPVAARCRRSLPVSAVAVAAIAAVAVTAGRCHRCPGCCCRSLPAATVGCEAFAHRCIYVRIHAYIYTRICIAKQHSTVWFTAARWPWSLELRHCPHLKVSVHTH